MKKLIATIILFTITSIAHSVDLKIFTAEGHVGFTAGDHWVVIGSQTKPPVAVMAFQIPNQADEGTPDSTNLSLSLFTPDSEKAHNALAKIGQSYGTETPKKENYKEWKTYHQSAKQGKTNYIVLDATKKIADVVVGVRLAWPQLTLNNIGYDEEMRQLFFTFLDSINGQVDNYEPKPNEVLRRPIN
jgi:hypothetical protein